MKMELPLAFLLLAIGGAMWIVQNGIESNADSFGSTPQQVDLSEEIDRLATGQSQSSAQQFHGDVQFAALPEDFGDLEAEGSVEAVAFEEKMKTAIEHFQFSNFAPEQNEPASLLASAAEALRTSGPVACKARISISMFDQEIEGTGQYLHAGQGTDMTRLDLAFQIDEETELTWNQICDGQFFYWIETFEGKREINFIDTTELNDFDSLGQSAPTRWLTQSGMASLLQNLSEAFEFIAPTGKEVGGIEMLHLRGQWKTESLRNVFAGGFGTRKEVIDWSKLPPQVPHRVEVFLGNDDYMPLFPYRVVFSKVDPESDTLTSPVMTFELFEVQKLTSISNEYFQVTGNNSEQTDLSDSYRDQIKHIVEAAAFETIKR